MDNARAIRLLKKWINFYGMEIPDEWEAPANEEPIWPIVQRTTQAFKYVIACLEGKPVPNNIGREEAVKLVAAWPEFNGMDNPDAWDEDIYPFVRNCRKAINYALDILNSEK